MGPPQSMKARLVIDRRVVRCERHRRIRRASMSTVIPGTHGGAARSAVAGWQRWYRRRAKPEEQTPILVIRIDVYLGGVVRETSKEGHRESNIGASNHLHVYHGVGNAAIRESSKDFKLHQLCGVSSRHCFVVGKQLWDGGHCNQLDGCLSRFARRLIPIRSASGVSRCTIHR